MNPPKYLKAARTSPEVCCCGCCCCCCCISLYKVRTSEIHSKKQAEPMPGHRHWRPTSEKPNKDQQGKPMPEFQQHWPARQSPTKSSKVNQSRSINNFLWIIVLLFSNCMCSLMHLHQDITCPFTRQFPDKHNSFSAKQFLMCLLQQNIFQLDGFQKNIIWNNLVSNETINVTSIAFYRILSFVDTITNPSFLSCLHHIHVYI